MVNCLVVKKKAVYITDWLAGWLTQLQQQNNTEYWMHICTYAFPLSGSAMQNTSNYVWRESYFFQKGSKFKRNVTPAAEWDMHGGNRSKGAELFGSRKFKIFHSKLEPEWHWGRLLARDEKEGMKEGKMWLSWNTTWKWKNYSSSSFLQLMTILLILFISWHNCLCCNRCHIKLGIKIECINVQPNTVHWLRIRMISHEGQFVTR